MSFNISIDPSIILLCLLAITASYFSRLNIIPPNGEPHPSRLEELDIVNKLGVFHIIRLLAWVFPLIGLYHSFIAITYPSAPLCPHPQNLSPSLFTWSLYPLTILTLLILLVSFRMKAYTDLGPNFTFQLVAPKELVTRGIYKYVQHPSYPTGVGALICSILIWLHPNGVLGCFLPEAIANSTVLPKVFWALFGLLAVSSMPKRVREEEAMLKREFGMQWVEYNKRTPRFIPFLL